MADYVYATDTTWVTELVCLHKDEQWPADDPIVKKFPANFTDQVPQSVLRGGGVRAFDRDGNVVTTPPSAKSEAGRRGRS